MKFSERALSRMEKAVKATEEASEDAGQRPVHVIHNPCPIMTCLITDAAVSGSPYQGYIAQRRDATNWDYGEVKVWIRPAQGTTLTVGDMYACRPSHGEKVDGTAGDDRDVYLAYPYRDDDVPVVASVDEVRYVNITSATGQGTTFNCTAADGVTPAITQVLSLDLADDIYLIQSRKYAVGKMGPVGSTFWTVLNPEVCVEIYGNPSTKIPFDSIRFNSSSLIMSVSVVVSTGNPHDARVDIDLPGQPLYLTTVPATSTSPGSVGLFAMDGTYLYICSGTNSWRRAAWAGGTW